MLKTSRFALLAALNHRASHHSLAQCIQILRELGGQIYENAVAWSKDDDLARVFNTIMEDLVGPDAYWGGAEEERPLASRWGNLWTVPFPPTVVGTVGANKRSVITHLSVVDYAVRRWHRGVS